MTAPAWTKRRARELRSALDCPDEASFRGFATHIAAALAELDRRGSLLAELEQALRTYGDHHDARRGDTCKAKPGMPGDGRCTCGFDAARAGTARGGR